MRYSQFAHGDPWKRLPRFKRLSSGLYIAHGWDMTIDKTIQWRNACWTAHWREGLLHDEHAKRFDTLAEAKAFLTQKAHDKRGTTARRVVRS